MLSCARGWSYFLYQPIAPSAGYLFFMGPTREKLSRRLGSKNAGFRPVVS